MVFYIAFNEYRYLLKKTINNRLVLDVKVLFNCLQEVAVSMMLEQINRMTGFFVEAHTIRYMAFDS